MSNGLYLIVVREYDDDSISEERFYSEPLLAYAQTTDDLGFELRSSICDAQIIANDGIEHQLVSVAYDYEDGVAVRGVEYDPIRGQFVGQSADEIAEELQLW